MQFESLGLLGLFLSAFVSSTLAPGGSEIVLALLVKSQQFSLLDLVAVATVGNSLGALTTFWLGVWMSRKYPSENLLNSTRQKSLTTIKRWGIFSLLLSWLPIVGDGLCFAAGWLRLSLYGSMVLIAIGKALRYLVIAYAIV